MQRRWLVVPVVLLGAALGIGAVLANSSRIPQVSLSALASRINPEPEAGPVLKPEPTPASRAELATEGSDALRLPTDVVETLEIDLGEARAPSHSRTLRLSGSLALDSSSLAHVHTRFEGEVVELGQTSEAEGTARRPLRFGDRVAEGQILAVLWSSVLGEKKSEYVDVLSRLKLEQETLDRQEALFKEKATPERNVREARRVESAEIALARVERTLRSWRLSEGEITELRAEAEKMIAADLSPDPDREESWARVEIRAPLAGSVLEKNIAVGDIVDTTTDLFKIADLSTLRIWAYVYEEDLPSLLDLPEPISWEIPPQVRSQCRADLRHNRTDWRTDRPEPAHRFGCRNRRQCQGPDAHRPVRHGGHRPAPDPRGGRGADRRPCRGR